MRPWGLKPQDQTLEVPKPEKQKTQRGSQCDKGGAEQSVVQSVVQSGHILCMKNSSPSVLYMIPRGLAKRK